MILVVFGVSGWFGCSDGLVDFVLSDVLLIELFCVYLLLVHFAIWFHSLVLGLILCLFFGCVVWLWRIVA